MNKGFGETTGRRIRTKQSDDASASCSGSSHLDPASASSAYTLRFTTPSTFNVISSPDLHCGSAGPKLPQSGKMPRSGMTLGEPWFSMRARESRRDKAQPRHKQTDEAGDET